MGERGNAIPTTAFGYGTGTNRSFIKFAASNPPAANARVTSATLSLFQTTAYASSSTALVAYMAWNAWDSMTLTWGNQPTITSVRSATVNAFYNTQVNVDVTGAVYRWWQGGVTNNGFALQYADESQPCDFFASDDYGSNLPTLTVNYVADTTPPGQGSVGLTATGTTYRNPTTGTLYSNNPTVTLSPSYSNSSATTAWSINWTSASGVGTGPSGTPAASFSVDAAGSQLTASTTPCGATACWVSTYFTATQNVANWPTFTAMFKSDSVPNFAFGAMSSGSLNNRLMVYSSSTSTTAFDHFQVTYASGSTYSTGTTSIPISANTWYYGQVAFLQTAVGVMGEIYIWAVGQPRPSVAQIHELFVGVPTPGLVFQQLGNNGTSKHSVTIANVTISTTPNSYNASPTAYGVSLMEISNNGTTWSCPAPASGTWCVASQRQAGWTLSSGDGSKTVSVKFRDNAGLVSSSAAVTPSITLDTTAPTASVTTPTSGREVRGVATVAGSASDGSGSGLTNASDPTVGVGLYVDGVQAGTAVQGAASPTFTWDTTNLPSGPHVLQVRAKDAVGNVGAMSAGVTVDVSNTGQMPYETYAMRDLPGSGALAGVNVATGNAVVTQADLDIPGRGPDLSISRTYNTLSPVSGLLGVGWASELDEGLVANADGSVTYRDATGGFHVFLPNGSGGYTTSPGLYLTLVKNADSTFTLTAHDQSVTAFDASGYLTSVTDRNGNRVSVSYDASHLPTAMSDAAGRQLTFTTAGGHVTHIAGPSGSATSYGYTYDANGNLTDFTDQVDSATQAVTTHYGYDTSHRLTAITLNYQAGVPADAQTNVTTTLGYDTLNRLVSLIDPLQYDVVIAYGAAGSGQTTVKQLQTNSTTTPATQSAVYESTVYQQTTDGSGAIASIIDPLGDQTVYQYNGLEQLTQVTDAEGRISTSTYDANGNELTHVADPGAGHLDLTTSFTYDASNNLLTQVVDPGTGHLNLTTKYTYDAPTTGNATQVVKNYVAGGPSDDHTNVTTSSTYDTYGEALTRTDALGIVTRYSYDAYGDVTQTIANYSADTPCATPSTPSNSTTNVTTCATYDVLGQQLTSTDALGVVTASTYDIHGQLIQTLANDVAGAPADSQTNVATSTSYDALGRAVTQTNARGIVTQTSYDADGRVTKTVQNYVAGGPTDDHTNVASTTSYDAAGNATLATDAKGNTTTTTYDLANRATEVKTQASQAGGGAVVSDTLTVYDRTGQTLSKQTIDGNTNPTTHDTYDAAGRTATEQDPPASPGATDQSGYPNTTTTTYDAAGNVTDTVVTNAAVTGPVSATHAVYDAVGMQTSKTEESGTTDAQTTTYAHDAAGRQTSMTTSAGTTSAQTTTTAYDALGRATTVTHPDQSQDTSTYDADGRRLSLANSAGTTTDSYDPLGRVASETRTVGGATQTTVSYAYDANGNTTQKSTSYASGTLSIVQSQYDALDRLSWMNDGTRSTSYDANGNVTHMTVAASEQSGTALAATYGYDGGNRLTSLTDTVGPGGTQLHSYAYTYDGSGNRKTIAEDGTTTTYTYDGDNQLTTITDSAGTTTLASYSYDAHHNRATMVTSAGTTSYAYDTAGVELTQVTDPNNAVTQYIYDQQTGNLTQKVRNPGGGSLATTYKYVSAGYLSEVDMPDGSKVQYVYDGLGQRLSKSLTSGGTTPTTTVVNDVYEGGLIAYEASANGTLLAAFTYDGDGSPTSVQVGADVTTAPRYYYIYNGHGDVVALVDGSGNRVAEYGYDAFGVPTEVTESFTNGWTNPYRYDGRDRVRYDAETGLYWMNARAYDPTLGRFISRDTWSHAPMVEALVDPYVYAANNPLVNVDPSGHQWSRAAVTGNTSHPGMPRAGLFKCGTWTFALHLTNPLRLGAIGMIGGCNKPVIVANATMSLYRGYDFLGMIFWIRDSFWHACAYHGIIENEWKFCPDFQKDKVSTWTKPVNPGELWAVKTVWTAISAEQDAGTATNFASVRF